MLAIGRDVRSDILQDRVKVTATCREILVKYQHRSFKGASKVSCVWQSRCLLVVACA